MWQKEYLFFASLQNIRRGWRGKRGGGNGGWTILIRDLYLNPKGEIPHNIRRERVESAAAAAGAAECDPGNQSFILMPPCQLPHQIASLSLPPPLSQASHRRGGGGEERAISDLAIFNQYLTPPPPVALSLSLSLSLSLAFGGCWSGMQQRQQMDAWHFSKKRKKGLPISLASTSAGVEEKKNVI